MVGTHIKKLERNKVLALIFNEGNYERIMSISANARIELDWREITSGGFFHF